MLLQALLFGIVGAVNTIVDFTTYLLLTRGLEVGPIKANVISFILGSVNSYVMNGKLTFRSRSVQLASLSRVIAFAAVTCISLCISSATMFLLIGPLTDIPAKIISVLVTFTFGFLMSRVLVYRGQGSRE